MSDGIHDESKTFLSRWSRLKRDAQEAEPNAAAPLDANQGAVAPLQQQQKDAHAESEVPQLPPVDELTLDSDFRGFLHPKVDEDVRRAALKKLFSDPHFNVMDGLDTYIDDYSKPDPLPLEMLAQMKSAQQIFRWAKNELDEDESAPKPTAPAQQDMNPAPTLDVSAPAGGIVPTQEVPRAADKMEPQPVALDAALQPLDSAAQDKK
jgi:hypothetical protein